MIKSFKDLIIYRKAIILVTKIYKPTKLFPSNKMYGLSNQLIKFAVSISYIIVNGYYRKSSIDYKGFFRIAISSLFELLTQIEIASKQKIYLSQKKIILSFQQSNETELMILSLNKKIK